MNPKKLEGLMKKQNMIARADHINALLCTIPNENADREGLRETPWRVAAMYEELFSGYKADPKQVLLDAVFTDVDCKDLVIVRDIPFYSTCEHHMMPFFGTAAVAYIPQDGRIVGLSKIARLVDVFARRLQVQERMGKQIADTIEQTLNPRGIAVILKAEHLCMSARGVSKMGATTVTSCLRGSFFMDGKAREELTAHLQM